jgi:HEAT repeat protein
MTTHTAEIVAALDDPESEVRAAALDAIGDLRDPASLQGLVVRLHDQTLPRGRRTAAMSAFGPSCEPFLLEMAEIDATNRANYARALVVCGTRRARPALCRWTHDPRLEVRVAALTALGHVGLDKRAALLAIEALGSGHVMVRAKAAFALREWRGPENAARLAQHLDDAWPVAALAAQSLQTLGDAGIVALQATASRSGVAAVLARQALWELSAPC